VTDNIDQAVVILLEAWRKCKKELVFETIFDFLDWIERRLMELDEGLKK
jgi:predicted transcriptional regulator